MTTYALLIYRTAPASEPMPDHDEQRALVEHRALQAAAAERGALHAVARLDAPKHGRTIRATQSGHEITDGPFIESKEWLVGFYVLDCRDEAEALREGKRLCPDRHHGD
ncbi:MAG: hypothetical protein KC492_27655 [Myxococcales bacterium]|nr:hypothetical protein [Myxococcales bacterium]MCB9608288.1 hypothetical protein [Polyangiaceae bacterium]